MTHPPKDIGSAVAEGTTIRLPFPPSVNALYRAVGGRSILSEKYRRWKREAGLELISQRPAKMPGAVSVEVELCPPNNRRRDIDNAGFKAVLDLLVTHQIIQGDDSTFVRSIKASWVESGDPCLVTINGVAE